MGRKFALRGAVSGQRRRRSRHRHEESTNGRRFSWVNHSAPLNTGDIGGIRPVDGLEASFESQEGELCNLECMESVEEEFADEIEEVEADLGEQGAEQEQDLLGARNEAQSPCTGEVAAVVPVSDKLVLDNWLVLWGFILTKGSRKLTKDQYQSVRNLAYGFAAMTATSWKEDWSMFSFEEDGFRNKVSVLPHYSTIQKKYNPLVLNRLAVRAVEHEETVDETKAGARFDHRAPDGGAKITLRTILPSEYARADMSSPAVWAEMRSTSLCAVGDAAPDVPAASAVECIDTAPVVAARGWFYGPQKYICVDCDGSGSFSDSTGFAEIGDSVTVRIVAEQQHPGFSEVVERCFAVENCPLSIRGVFSHSWTVHESSRQHDSMYQEEYSYVVNARDQKISKVFKFLSYRSPNDSISVPIPPLPVPAMQNECSFEYLAEDNTPKNPSSEMTEVQKTRRAALRERNRQLDAAWRSWEKPLLKPGDFVALLRPCSGNELNDPHIEDTSRRTLLTDVDKLARVCVVHRFWVEREERSRHVFFIAGGADLSCGGERVHSDLISPQQYCTAMGNNNLMRYAHVRSVTMSYMHRGRRGPQKYTPVSSVGVLDNGEPYFVYRIVIFWDGFNIRSGNSASGEGVYMNCLNLPAKARSSSRAVRILGLTPPGVKATAVLHRIMQDIVTGATAGFSDYDADGTKRRIFIDLVGVVGDTPALNSVLDVLGHTARACCHLCRFVRLSKTSVGSRYGNSPGDGTRTAFRRGYFQHSAVHDSGAQDETCRLLGIRSNPNDAHLPLHVFRTSLFQARDGIPVVGGLPVVPYDYDPYIGAFVAPDHLLSGHLRDCISLVLRLLPSKRHLKACENSMLRFIREAGLPCQNRLIDHEKAALYTMSMTDMFALGMVAELGFLGGCAEVAATTRAGSNSGMLSSMCKRAIELVGSCSRLIADIWRRPDLERDGIRAVNQYELGHGTFHMMGIRKALEVHIAKVEALCAMSDEDKELLDHGHLSKQRKSELSKMYRMAMIAIKCVDKPNLHRLREMVYTTLPMLGHVSLVGELVLEKSHQRLKRVLKSSNNRDAQLEALKSISSDDWIGRLTLVASDCISGDEQALLAGYRLLRGRESIERMHGKMTDVYKEDVRRAFGPADCILSELNRQGKSVISPRSATLTKLVWSLKGASDRISTDLSSRNTGSDVEKYFRLAFQSDYANSVAFFSDSISLTSCARLSGQILRRGDVIEILCCRPQNHEFHFPFVLQPNSFAYAPSLAETSGSSLWYILRFVKITGKDGMELPGRAKFYIAVQPCIPTPSLHESPLLWTEGQSHYNMYQIRKGNRISFAEVVSSMRRVGVISTNLDTPNAAKPISNGDPFVALTREKGYPPRQG